MSKKASNRVNMIDKIYNSWKVLSHSHTNNKIAYYKCECLECNTEHIVDGRNVRNGSSKRCIRCGLDKTAHKLIGVLKTNKTSKELAEYYLMNSMKKSGVKRKKEWSLTMQQFLSLIYANCYYCGLVPSTTVNPTNGHELAASRASECFITYNGIDRVDSSKGYTPDNTVTCCEQCNRAKLDYTTDEFLAWARRLVGHQNKTNT